MPIVPLTPLATPPDPNDRSTFEARAYPFTVSQQTMVGEFNANVPALNDAATAASGALAASHYKGAWSALTGPLAIPATVTHGADHVLYMLLETVADVAAEEPGISSKWKALVASPLARKARTANTQLAAGDAGSWIEITAGTFTQTFAAASVLGAGWWCYLGNSGLGDVTLDPDGAETIDGLASYVMYPGEVRLVQCDGVVLRTVVINAYSKVFTTSANWVVPPGYRDTHVGLWGAGSGGTAVSAGQNLSGVNGSAGGAGYMGRLGHHHPAAGTVVGITIGSGGAGGVSSTGTPVFGGSGGASSIGSPVNMTAGGGSSIGGSFTGPKGGSVFPFSGSPSVGNTLFGGGYRDTSERHHTVYGGGGDHPYGNGGTMFGGPSGTDGLVGNVPGGGGGCKSTPSGTATAGAGARGECRLMGVI